MDLDEALAATEPEPVTAVSTVTPKRCARHSWGWTEWMPPDSRVLEMVEWCVRCHKVKDQAVASRGRQARNYGNRAELDVARRYGGTKTGHHGGPVDVRGAEWNTQVKTHRRLPPAEWRTVFAKLDASTDRLPRLLLRFVHPGGPTDFVVVPGKAWLDWFGKDDEEAA